MRFFVVLGRVWEGFWEGVGKGLGPPGRLSGHFSASFFKALWPRGPQRRPRSLLGSISGGFKKILGGVWQDLGYQN